MQVNNYRQQNNPTFGGTFAIRTTNHTRQKLQKSHQAKRNQEYSNDKIKVEKKLRAKA